MLRLWGVSQGIFLIIRYNLGGDLVFPLGGGSRGVKIAIGMNSRGRCTWKRDSYLYGPEEILRAVERVGVQSGTDP